MKIDQLTSHLNYQSAVGRFKGLSPLAKKVAIIGTILVVVVVAGAVWLALHASNKVDQSSNKAAVVTGSVSDPAVLSDADLYVAIRKRDIAASDADSAVKLLLRIDTARYFANTNKYDKMLTELMVVKQDFPEAPKSLDFLAAVFMAQGALKLNVEAKITAKQFVSLEARNKKLFSLVSPATKKAIERYAR